jgi:hypothetical protein
MFIIYAIGTIDHKFMFLGGHESRRPWKGETYAVTETLSPSLLGPGHFVDLLHLDQKSPLEI